MDSLTIALYSLSLMFLLVLFFPRAYFRTKWMQRKIEKLILRAKNDRIRHERDFHKRTELSRKIIKAYKTLEVRIGEPPEHLEIAYEKLLNKKKRELSGQQKNPEEIEQNLQPIHEAFQLLTSLTKPD